MGRGPHEKLGKRRGVLGRPKTLAGYPTGTCEKRPMRYLLSRQREYGEINEGGFTQGESIRTNLVSSDDPSKKKISQKDAPGKKSFRMGVDTTKKKKKKKKKMAVSPVDTGVHQNIGKSQ